MNWVGGVKRRVIMKEEEQRRQQEFFAKQSLLLGKGKRMDTGKETWTRRKNSFNSGVGKRKEDYMQYKRIKVDQFRKSEDEKDKGAVDVSETGVPSKSISRGGVRISHNLKLSSCHTAFSEMLIKMEYKGSKEKMKVNDREEKRKFRKQKEIDKFVASSAAANCDNPFPRSSGRSDSSHSNFKTPQRGIVPLMMKSYDKSTSTKFWNNVNPMEGAPRMRRVLSLSPGKFNRKRIWTPIEVKDSVTSRKKKSVSSKAYKTVQEEDCLSDASFAQYMVAKILKTPPTSNSHRIEVSSEGERGENFYEERVIEAFEGKPNFSETANLSQPNFVCFKSQEKNLLELKELKPLSGDHRRKLPTRNVIQKVPGNREREPSLPMSLSGKVKLGDCVRKLFVIENSFKMKNRVDMTPYIDNESVSLLWTPADVNQSKIEESESSFKTPSDPTFTDLQNVSFPESDNGNIESEEASTSTSINDFKQHPEDDFAPDKTKPIIRSTQSPRSPQNDEITDDAVFKEDEINGLTTPFLGSIAALKILSSSTNKEPPNCRSFTAYEYNEVMAQLTSSRRQTDKKMLREVLEITSSSSSASEEGD